MKEKKGNLSGKSLPKILHVIYSKADPAGILDISQEPVKKRFYFKDGMPVAATSNILNEVLGRLLMQEGVITQKDYEDSLETVLREKKKHGEVLISAGLITADKLEGFLTLQLKRRLWTIFGWSEGSYRYVKAEALPPGITQKPVNPADLILDGISLGFYPLSSIKADLKDYLDRPIEAAPGAGRYRLEDFHLAIQEKRFFETFDGVKTLREVLEGSDLLRQRALALALAFIITGLVRKTGEKEEAAAFGEEEAAEARPAEGAAPAPSDTRLNAELLFMRAKTALSNKYYRNAIETLKEITDLNPLEAEYWAYLGWATFQSDPSRVVEAEKIIRDAIDINNELDIAWLFLGYTALSRGSEAEAEKAFHTAFRKNPHLLEAMAELKRLRVKGLVKPLNRGARDKYMEFFGFAEDPFTDEPFAKFLSLSDGQSNALDSAVKAIRRRTGPMLVEGVCGAGKTTLALELAGRLKNQKILCALVLSPPKNEIELIKEINSDIGGVSESASIKEQLLTLGMRVSQNKTQNGHTVIVIDNAHALTPGCLKLIQYVARLKSLQIVLLAEASLAERLKDPELRELDQKLSSRFILPPLTMEEAHAYVLRRISSAEKKPSALMKAFLFSDEDLKGLYEKTGGVPGLINAEGALLLAAASEKETAISVTAPEKTEEKPTEEKADEAFFYEEPSFTPEEDFKEPEAAGSRETVDEGAPGAKEFKAESEETEGLKGREKEGKAGTPLPEKKAPLTSVETATPPEKTHPLTAPRAREKTVADAALPPKKRPGGILRLVFWVVAMLILGLAIGSLIGVLWFSRSAVVAPQQAIKDRGVEAPKDNTADKTEGLSSTAEAAHDKPAGVIQDSVERLNTTSEGDTTGGLKNRETTP